VAAINASKSPTFSARISGGRAADESDDDEDPIYKKITKSLKD
jgi:hypothetical protein